LEYRLRKKYDDPFVRFHHRHHLSGVQARSGSDTPQPEQVEKHAEPPTFCYVILIVLGTIRAENEVNDDTRGHAFLSKVPLVGQAMKIISNFEPTTVMPNMYRHGKIFFVFVS
jgi:hypothetical protein